MIYQGLLAGYKVMPKGFRVSMLHLLFVEALKNDHPVSYQVKVLRQSKNSGHLEVNAVQFGKVGTVIILGFINLNSKDRFGPQPYINYTYSLGSASGFVPFKRDYSDVNTDLVFDTTKFRPDMMEDSRDINCIEMFHPIGLFEGTCTIFDNDVEDVDAITEREVYAFARAKPPPAGAAENTELSTGVLRDLFLSYLSDTSILGSAFIALGFPFGTSLYQVSLDHCMYYHEPKTQTSIYDFHVLKARIIKGSKGQYTVFQTVYNKHAEILCMIIQEGLSVVDNRLGQVKFPTVYNKKLVGTSKL